MSVSHLANSAPLLQIQDTQEALQGGGGTKAKEKAEKFVEAKRTSPKQAAQAQVAEKLKQEQSKETKSGPQQASAAKQVDAAELSTAVAQRGGNSPKEEIAKNKRFFKLLVTNQPGMEESFVESVIQQTLDKSKDKSRVETAFPYNPSKENAEATDNKRALVKVVLLDLAILQPAEYGLESSEIPKLKAVRDKLQKQHSAYIEKEKYSMEGGAVIAKPLKMGVKQAAGLMRFALNKSDNVQTGFMPFIRWVATRNPSNPLAFLKTYKASMVALVPRVMTALDPGVLKVRDHLFSSNIIFANQAIGIHNGFEKLIELCYSSTSLVKQKNDVTTQAKPDPFKMMLVVVEALATGDIVSARKLSTEVEKMSLRGRQIFLTNLKGMMMTNEFFKSRADDKQHKTFMRTINNLLSSSYTEIKKNDDQFA